MTAIERILVAVALDRRDAVLVRHAARLAHTFRSPSVVLGHVEPVLQDASPTVLPLAGGGGAVSAERRLRQLADAQRSDFPTATQLNTVVCRGQRIPELLRLATELSTDLLVAARRPRDEHDAVSDALMNLEWTSPCSLLVVPDSVSAEYERILVGCDFSDHTLGALQTAVQIARGQRQASITIQHVVSLPTTTMMAGRSVEEFTAILRADARRMWEAFAEKVDWQGVPHSLRIEEADQVPDAITRAAAQVDANLIVLGSHGHSKAAGALLGHVAATVCGRATRTFLCVKRKGEVTSLLGSLLSPLSVAADVK